MLFSARALQRALLVGGTTVILSLAISAAANACVSTDQTPISGATLQVDGAPSSQYAVEVCKTPTGMTQVYNFSINTDAAAAGKVFTISFDVLSADRAVSAEVYGKVRSFTVVESKVTIVATPIAMTQVNGPPNAGTTCALPETPVGVCQTNPAKLTGGIRYTTSFGIVRPDDALVGMFVGASANGYQVGLQGCTGISYGSAAFATAAQGDTRPGDTRPGDAPGGGGAPQQSSGPVLTVEMNGPHFQDDGLTLNFGTLEAFMPDALLASCVGGDAAAAKAGLSVSRTEDGATTAVGAGAFTATAEADGLRIVVPSVAFSAPTYKMTFKKTALIAKPKATFSKGKSNTVTAAITRVSGVTYAITAAKGKTTKKGTCKVASKKVTCTIKLAKGSWKVSITPKKSGKSGTPATKTIKL